MGMGLISDTEPQEQKSGAPRTFLHRFGLPLRSLGVCRVNRFRGLGVKRCTEPMKSTMSQTSTPTRFSQVTCLRDETDQSEEAFRAFVDRSSARAMRVAWRMLGEDPGAAEDVVQDAFVAAWKALPEFRGEASLDTWFFRILVRRAQNHRRWKNIRTLWSAPPDIDPADPKPEPSTDPLLRGRIQKALKGLSRRQRESFLLVHMDGFSVRETAAILSLRPGTIKSHVHRARLHLRTELSDLTKNPHHLQTGRSGDTDDSE
ncbi:MAG: hypothetical protein CMN75_05220 [Spirochaeta sp.]|nr:hypothetical protein [Spirochaeta sp.]RPG03409.1 MAG: RNA polymerase sigma factor [Proteobacteria bacterium TMED72]